jgi:putative salt-induced outer membrane protein YdiY
MTREPGNLSRSVAWASLLAVALLHVYPQNAAAEEPPAEAPPAAEAAPVEDAPAEATGAETVASIVTAPGGVPAEPTDADAAVDAVKASMARVAEQEAAGIGSTYIIEFGDTFDWVRMVSGEWLKGEMKRLRDDNLEFDSDKLDMQNIDFTDVTHVHSPVVNTYVFDDRISATGLAVITPDKVIVETDEGTKTFPRSELESIVAGGEREKDWWSMKLRFGLTLNKGNTDQLTYDINFNVRREDRMTLLDLGYNTSFGRSDGTQNVNRHLGDLDFKVFLSSRWFAVPLFGQLFNDRFQNIELRATPAAGAGVHIIDVPNVKWDFQTGLGYQYLSYLDASAVTTGNPQNDVFIPLYTYADFDITGDIDLTLSWLTNLVVTTIGNTNHTAKADLAIELTSVIDLDIAFLYLRTEHPAELPPATPPDPDPDPIKKNDYQLVVGISLELG